MESKIKVTLERLKKEFIGLDETIDRLGIMITPWLETPELMRRPLVISLWGMTGTGKSSLVRRIIDELGYMKSTMFFDCGECTSDSSSIVYNLCDTFGLKEGNDDTAGKTTYTLPHPILVFDEFQYARTLNEEGHEEVCPGLRPIWYILDSGVIDITDSYSWSAARALGFIKKLVPYAGLHRDIVLKKGMLVNPEDVKSFNLFLGDNLSEPENDECSGPVSLIEKDLMKQYVSSLENREKGLGYKFVDEYYKTDMPIQEVIRWLDLAKQDLCIPKILDLSNALVFVIGNLDEAYGVEGDINPDLDADVLYEVTSKVAPCDVKAALSKRFRAEQVARLGNNMLLYPTLKTQDFKDVIDLEIGKVLKDFGKGRSGKVEITQTFRDLVYFEGVYPVQGVRPVVSTINTMLLPILSKIKTEFPESEEVTVDVETKDFRVDSVNISLQSGDRQVMVEQRLQLGALRNPRSRKKRYICSVHEIGHAIVYSYLTGNLPSKIVSVSTDRGGFCYTYNKHEEGEIPSRRNVDSEIMTSIGGYLAENLIYGERQDMCLLGSGSDLREAWSEFSQVAYGTGYFSPISYASPEVDSGQPFGVPNGEDPKRQVYYYDGRRFTVDRISLEEAVSRRLGDFVKEVKLILEANKDLLRKAALSLGESGTMTGLEFKKFIDCNDHKSTRSLTPDRLREAQELGDPEYYWKVLI